MWLRSQGKKEVDIICQIRPFPLKSVQKKPDAQKGLCRKMTKRDLGVQAPFVSQEGEKKHLEMMERLINMGPQND